MKVERNQSIYVGNRSHRSPEKREDRKTLFAGDMKQDVDPIWQKRQEAQKKALKVVTDAWDGDKQIDNTVESMEEHIRQLQTEMGQARKELGDLTDKQDELKRQFEETGDAEYEEWANDLQERIDYLSRQVDDFEAQIGSEGSAITNIRLERLKSAPMVKAEKQADAIMEAASKEIIGMLVEEGREHIQEKMEEQQKKAEAIEEKKEEQEELLEKRKTEREKAEEFVEEMAESMPVLDMLGMSQKMDEIQKEIKEIVDKMKLLSEDIKGVVVDEIL